MHYVTKTLVTCFVGLMTACMSTHIPSGKPFEEITNFKIKIQRTGCFGSCPSYILEVSEDGTVSYCGMGYVEQTGLKARQISRDKVHALYDQVLAAEFFNLRDEYTAMITDSPAYIVTVTLEGRTKTVIDYVGSEVGMPASVTEIQNSIDEAAGVSDWVGSIREPNDGGILTWKYQECEKAFE